MNSVTGLVAINDVVVLTLISNAFWLIVFLVCVGIFRTEVRALLSSLSSFSIAGSRFELGGKTLTLKSYSILSNIFLDLLCNSANAEKLAQVFSEINAQQLTRFTLKYLLEAPKEEMNFPLIRNVAYIAGRRGNLQDSLSLYKFLISKAPDDTNLRNDMGILLLSTNPSEAKKLYGDLMNEYPGVHLFRYNYALTNITLDNYDEGIKDLTLLIKEGYSLTDPDIFNRPAIKKLAGVKPEEYSKLLILLQEEEQRRQQLV